ncbi:Flp pilus assembly protein CpaB [Tessaracoccus sp. Z1128]
MFAAIVAALLTLVGGVLVASYVRGADQRALDKLQPTSVLVVTEQIPVGSAAGLGTNVEVRDLPALSVASGALTDVTTIADLVTSTTLYPGEQLLPERFVAVEDLTNDQVVLPPNFVQVTVVLSPERVIGGRLKAGDTVGVVMSTGEPASTETILHRALVARVQGLQPDEEAGENAPPDGSQFITFAVTAIDAERIVWVAEHASMWLTLERETSLVEGTKQVTLENVAS